MMNKMPQVTIAYALILIIGGICGYFYFDRASLTILIPTWFGLVVLLAGVVALKESFLKHAMHFAAMLGILGVLASAKGAMQLPTLMSGGEVLRPNAVIMQSGMFFTSVVFVIICVMSFVSARKARLNNLK